MRYLTSPEHSKRQSEVCPQSGSALPDALATRGYVPWDQISSLIILVSTWLGNTPRIENTESTSWKPLRSSSGHALDDDDDMAAAPKFYFVVPKSKCLARLMLI